MAPEAIVPHVPGRAVAIRRLAPEQPPAGRPPETAERHGQAVHHAQPHPVGEVQAGNGPAEPLPQPQRLAACLANAVREPIPGNHSAQYVLKYWCIRLSQ